LAHYPAEYYENNTSLDHPSMEIVIGIDHGQGTFKVGVVTFRQGELAKELAVISSTVKKTHSQINGGNDRGKG
jgi:hypothetical protein